MVFPCPASGAGRRFVEGGVSHVDRAIVFHYVGRLGAELWPAAIARCAGAKNPSLRRRFCHSLKLRTSSNTNLSVRISRNRVQKTTSLIVERRLDQTRRTATYIQSLATRLGTHCEDLQHILRRIDGVAVEWFRSGAELTLFQTFASHEAQWRSFATRSANAEPAPRPLLQEGRDDGLRVGRPARARPDGRRLHARAAWRRSGDVQADQEVRPAAREASSTTGSRRASSSRQSPAATPSPRSSATGRPPNFLTRTSWSSSSLPTAGP